VAKRRRSKEFQRRSRAAKLGWRRRKRRLARQRAKVRARAKARRELRAIQRKLPKRVRETERWEITIRYRPGQKKFVGLTLDVIAPVGTPREVILLVAKRAGQTGEVERGFKVEDINWQKGLREKAYPYGSDVQTGLAVPGWTGLFMGADVRVDRVKE
jgi:hypothetical protein